MTATSNQSTDGNAAFYEMKAIYEAFSPGPQAELRRVAAPKDLLLLPSFYRLSGGRTDPGTRRVVYILPWIRAFREDELEARAKKEGVNRRYVMPAGRAIALADKPEGGAKADSDKLSSIGMRLTQISRMESDNDIIQFRRLIQHLGKANELSFDWPALAWVLMKWAKETDGRTDKQRLLEDYFRERYASKKTEKKGN